MKFLEFTRPMSGTKFILNPHYIVKIESNYKTGRAIIYLADETNIEVEEQYSEIEDLFL